MVGVEGVVEVGGVVGGVVEVKVEVKVVVVVEVEVKVGGVVEVVVVVVVEVEVVVVVEVEGVVVVVVVSLIILNFIFMPKQQFVIFAEGEKVFIRTVTNFLVGEVVSLQSVGDNQFVVLKDASWIADTKRFYNFLKDGITGAVEVEPITGVCAVNVGSIVDVFEWFHDLPSVQQ